MSTKGKSGTCLIPFERTGSSPVFLKGRRVPPARTRMSLFSLGLNHTYKRTKHNWPGDVFISIFLVSASLIFTAGADGLGILLTIVIFAGLELY